MLFTIEPITTAHAKNIKGADINMRISFVELKTINAVF